MWAWRQAIGFRLPLLFDARLESIYSYRVTLLHRTFRHLKRRRFRSILCIRNYTQLPIHQYQRLASRRPFLKRALPHAHVQNLAETLNLSSSLIPLFHFPRPPER
jgi:hypothetical protein